MREYNTIINGAVDWVYEEEFGMSKGFEWNSDGTRIAFYRFDESAVKQWQMTTYGKLYPDLYKFKYFDNDLYILLILTRIQTLVYI